MQEEKMVLYQITHVEGAKVDPDTLATITVCCGMGSTLHTSTVNREQIGWIKKYFKVSRLIDIKGKYFFGLSAIEESLSDLCLISQDGDTADERQQSILIAICELVSSITPSQFKAHLQLNFTAKP